MARFTFDPSLYKLTFVVSRFSIVRSNRPGLGIAEADITIVAFELFGFCIYTSELFVFLSTFIL